MKLARCAGPVEGKIMKKPGKRAKTRLRPRTFEEAVAANLRDRFHAARLARLASGEHFDGPVGEVSVHPDCEGGSHWIVEWGDRGGGCYVTTFNGPLAEQRARDYFAALRSGRLKVLRGDE
jgi:hypothetical protein